jgi:hypothetical protein
MLSMAMRRSLVALGVAGSVAGCFGDGGGVDGSRDERPASAAELFRELEARPLGLPRVDLGGPSIREIGVAGRCVEGRGGIKVNAPVLREVVPAVAALGPWPPGPSNTRGPVYAAVPEGAPRIVILSALRRRHRDSQPSLVRTLWISRPSYDGPVLVRGGRLDRPGALGFGVSDPPRESLRLPAGSWAGIRVDARDEEVDAKAGWWVAVVPTQIRQPGCYAFQVDGLGFSYVLAFGVQVD